MIPLQCLPKTPTASLSALLLQASLDLPDHVAQVAEQLAQQPGLVAELSLVLALTQNQHLLKSHGKWALVAHTSEKYIGPLCLYLFFGYRRDQMQQFIFTLARMSQCVSQGWTLRNFPEVKGP